MLQKELLMCKSISCDLVIGHLIIEAVERDYDQISFDKIYKFDELISDALRKKEYVTRFSSSSLSDFQDNYPFFISSIGNECIKLVNFESNKESIMNRLIRHFRIGVPNTVITELTTVSNAIFG
jgi:hypothetical protein